MQIIMEYGINKGIGKSVEFRGLKAQYLFIFAGGLLAVFVVFVILYMAGVISGYVSLSALRRLRCWSGLPSA